MARRGQSPSPDVRVSFGPAAAELATEPGEGLSPILSDPKEGLSPFQEPGEGLSPILSDSREGLSPFQSGTRHSGGRIPKA